MADQRTVHDYERHQIDSIYENASEIAHQLRRMADEVDRTVRQAKENEGTSDSFRSTYLDLPNNIQHIVLWGIANSSLDRITRLVAELVRSREAIREANAAPTIERLQAFIAAHEVRVPGSGDNIAHYIHMEGPDDDRHEVNHIIDVPLLREIIDLLPKKAS